VKHPSQFASRSAASCVIIPQYIISLIPLFAKMAAALSDLTSAVLPVADVDDIGAVPLWLEIMCVFTCTIGFLLWRVFTDKIEPSKRKLQLDSKLGKSIESKLSGGDSQAALKAWRVEEQNVASTPDVLKLAVQALLEVSPDTAVDEVVEHMLKHAAVRRPAAAAAALDAASRAGKPEILESLVKDIESRVNVHLTTQMHEIILGGYAFSGDEERLKAHRAQLEEKMTLRAHSLVLRGLLRNRMADSALKQLKEMMTNGFVVPSFALSEIVKALCEAGRYTEVLDQVLPQISLTSEAACILLDHCLKDGNLSIAVRAKSILDNANEPLGVRGFDALLKLLASEGNLSALGVFAEMQTLNLPVSEGFCVGLLARCADSKFLRFAEVVVKYARDHLKMSIALYSALMKVYAYSSMYEEACDLYEQIEAQGLEPDQMMYNCLMKFAAQCGRMELSQKLAQRIPTLDIQNCMSLIRAASRDKDVGMACRVLEKFKALGQVPDTAAYNCALDVCAAAGDAKTAKKLLEEMKSLKAQPDMISYNTMLKCHSINKDIRAAKKMLDEMEAAGFPPNDISFNVIINMSVSAGDLYGAWDTVDKMMKKGIKADQYTISTMMKAVKRFGGDAMRVFELMDNCEIDIVKDEVLLNTVLETCVRYQEKHRILLILEKYSGSNMRPAMHTYGMLIRACSAVNQVERCRQLWHELVEDRALQPNELVLGCMLNALVSNGCVEDALVLLRKTKTAVKPNAVMYSTILKGFTSSGGAAKARELLDEMRADGIQMSTSLYNSLIDAHARIGAMDEVLRLRDTMKKDGYQPDDLTTSLIVKGYCADGNLKMAFEVFHEMSLNRVGDGDTVIFNTLLDGCIRQNNYQSADYLVEHMAAYKIKPTNFTLGIIVKMWGRRRQLDKAFDAVTSMTQKYDFHLNSPVQTCLMCACLLNNDLKRALMVFEQLNASGYGADAKAHGNLISGAIRLGNVDVAVKLTEEAFGLSQKKMGFQPKEMDTSVLGQLARSFHKEGNMDSLGMPLFKRLRERGVPVDGHLASMMQSGCYDGSAHGNRGWQGSNDGGAYGNRGYSRR